MMKSIKKHFIFRVQNEGKTFELSGPDDLSLSCDKGWLEEAISNLVKNSLDHTTEGNTIRLSWHSYASIIQIIVEDNGCGIHPEDMPFIFQRFYRSKFPEETSGTGLGLPLTKSIVEAHRGTIEVSSIPQNGTKFTINLLIPTKL